MPVENFDKRGVWREILGKVVKEEVVKKSRGVSPSAACNKRGEENNPREAHHLKELVGRKKKPTSTIFTPHDIVSSTPIARLSALASVGRTTTLTVTTFELGNLDKPKCDAASICLR